MKNKTTIIGAGLVGSLLACYMRRRGSAVDIYERRGDMRSEQMLAGRSINLALSDRGIRALEEIVIMDEVRRIAIPMHGRFMHNADGTTAYQPYGKEGQFINSVSRAALNILLMNEAEKAGAQLHFHRPCKHIDWEKRIMDCGTGSGDESVPFELLFGADGSYSAARLNHQLQHDRFQYQQFYIDYGYKELHIPAGGDGGFQLKKNALHIWPRGNYMMIALPNTDGSFTCTLFFPFEGELSFASIDSEKKLTDFFARSFPDALKLMPDLSETYFSNPTSSLVTVKCFPWRRGDAFTLIGDAAHAIVPFFGQGMNAGFEDCFVLNRMLDDFNDDLEKALAAFEAERKPDADAIADLALANFVEMRDKVADPKFLLQKKIETKFAAAHPDKWTPAYSLVTFSPQIRYSEALARGNRQQAIMDVIMQTPDIERLWELPEIETKMQQLLSSHV